MHQYFQCFPVSGPQKFLSWNYGYLQRQLKLFLLAVGFVFIPTVTFFPTVLQEFSYFILKPSLTLVIIKKKKNLKDSDCIYFSLNIYQNLLGLVFWRKKGGSLLVNKLLGKLHQSSFSLLQNAVRIFFCLLKVMKGCRDWVIPPWTSELLPVILFLETRTRIRRIFSCVCNNLYKLSSPIQDFWKELDMKIGWPLKKDIWD